ncbi:unnamed protein product [Cylicocyclus nassatus]|uniref:C-type lectin domain-containing protein n=1 Tax=Cylicocyclus nassatus TaxID=53992 RepID=A0AA36GLQ6_CYLNA|nr:unnamed protein product [Cylicocyclus nassatus]
MFAPLLKIFALKKVALNVCSMTSSFSVESTEALNVSVTTSPKASQTQKPGTLLEKMNLIVLVLICNCMIVRRKRKQKLKLMEEMEREDEERRKKKKKKRKRKRLSRGVKPVIPLKPSQELKKALNEFLELQTQTLGSVMDEDEGASKKGSQGASASRKKAAGSRDREEDTEKKETSREAENSHCEPGACYKQFFTASFDNAERFCKTKGAHLASIHSYEENHFVAALAKTGKEWTKHTDYTWIGLRQVNYPKDKKGAGLMARKSIF